MARMSGSVRSRRSYVHTSCENCTSSRCMWCGNQKRCVDTNAYVASFPYGQCMEWTTEGNKCSGTRCSDMHTCEECKSNPLCGWCNDALSNTGLGRCMEGGYSGPVALDDTHTIVVNNSVCPDTPKQRRWYFTDCPLCQCNGHSSCVQNTSHCEECSDLTTGLRCEMCQDGYFGNPKNEGNCSACRCNGQADSCESKTGKCNCRTRGVIGNNCDKCDERHKYFGEPHIGGTCFYDLVTDYQFTFNLSKQEDQYFTQINFMNIPSSNDRDVEFTVNCSGMHAYLNITVRSKSKPEKVLVHSYLCQYFRAKFQHQDHSFGSSEDTTFLVYVYGFKTPFWLQISFSQFPKIDLVQEGQGQPIANRVDTPYKGSVVYWLLLWIYHGYTIYH